MLSNPLGLLLTVTFLSLSAGCYSPSTNAQEVCQETCREGCCALNGRCLPGLSSDACGRSGDACKSCGSGQACKEEGFGGTCGAACDTFNCDGCCTTSGVCQAGTSPSACGWNGDLCKSCGGSACEATGVGGGRCQ